jgi:hypothetical protein
MVGVSPNRFKYRKLELNQLFASLSKVCWQIAGKKEKAPPAVDHYALIIITL